MKIISAFKAHPVIKAEPVEPVTLVINRQLPERKLNNLKRWRRTTREEARKIADALCGALPQGVVDALLVELLDRKRTLLVAPMPTRSDR